MHKGSCHCGAVRMTLPSTPEVATDCNCSLCRRIGGPWVYFEFGTVRIEGHPEATAAYIWGDKTLRTIHCKTCGCVTALGAAAANSWREARGEPWELRSRAHSVCACSPIRRCDYVEVHRRVSRSLAAMAKPTPNLSVRATRTLPAVPGSACATSIAPE